jgi:glycosyltransferase involved in cell wall biosynthesis
LIGVAEVHPWHGFDRLIKGLGEYYRQQPVANSNKPDVFFHVVGGVSESMMHDFQTIIHEYNIEQYVVFHGKLFGDELTAVFNQCQFAIGSLARHRSGITRIKTLKNREYAARGIPFIYSEEDSDFDQQPYVLKAPADDSPVEICQILDFLNRSSMSPDDIRRTVSLLAWKYQMKRVIDGI